MHHRYAQPFTCSVCGAQTQTSPNWRKIFIHTKPGHLETCWASGLTPDGVQRHLLRTRSAIEHRPTGTPMPMPIWFPQWEEESYPSIVLFARRRMGFWIPRISRADHEEIIKDLLAKNVRPAWDAEHGCWTVSDDHFLELAKKLLKRHPRVSVGREYNELEACNWRCKNAQSPRCTCSCQARNHAHGNWMNGWNILFEDNRVMNSRNWSWMAVERKAADRG